MLSIRLCFCMQLCFPAA